MGRHARHTLTLPDGRTVGFSPKARGGLFRAVFPHPAEPGRYVEAATGVPVPKGWAPGKAAPPGWFAAARAAVQAAYADRPAAAPADRPPTWAEAGALLQEGVAREATRRTYRSAFGLAAAAHPDLPGPAALTAAHAARFARAYAAGRYRRGPGAADRPRGAQTVYTTLNNLSTVWGRLRKLGAVAENVWAGVDRPRVPRKLPRVPAEASVDALYAWLDRRFPGPDGRGWPLLKLFVDVKRVAGCRLNDLCQVRSAQLDPAAGTLRILADQDKTHRERLVHLPPGLAAALDALKGPEYLWERYAAESAVYRPGRRRARAFSPSLVYHAVKSAFREFGRAHPEHKVTTHDLRRRAITLTVVAAGGDVGAAAQAIPVTPQTAQRHYLDATRAYDAAALQRKAAGLLLGSRAEIFRDDSGAVAGTETEVKGSE